MPVSPHMPKGRKYGIYIVAATTWATGSLWIVYHYWMTHTDDFGFDGPHPMEKWWLIGHALFGFFAVWQFGMLWSNHIVPGWKRGRRRISGGTLFAIISWLVITGFLLYYLGTDSWRSWTSLGHWVVGQVAFCVFLMHVPLGSVGPKGSIDR